LTDEHLRQPAIVFAPHADDETLGCGGTIMRKAALGAPVSVVFLTDSGGSHKALSREELVARRTHEALAACQVLGVDGECVRFFSYPDGELAKHEVEASDRIAALLDDLQVTQVFVPYRHDNHIDHLASNRAVRSAIRAGRRPITMLEYPVWFWEHWPWMQTPTWWNSRRRRAVKRAVMAPVRELCDLQWWVDVSEMLERKRAALDAHATQMSSMDDNWETLADVSDGAFLDRLLQPREWFARRVVKPDR